jgi:hypothetical protein
MDAHPPAAALDVPLERVALSVVEQDPAGLREHQRVVGGQVLRREHGGVVGVGDLDGPAVLRPQLRGQVTDRLAGLHVGGVEVGLVEEEDPQVGVQRFGLLRGLGRCRTRQYGDHRDGDHQRQEQREATQDPVSDASST